MIDQTTSPKPAPDAMREALFEAGDELYLAFYNTICPSCSLPHKSARQDTALLEWAAASSAYLAAVYSAPVPPPDGAAERELVDAEIARASEQDAVISASESAFMDKLRRRAPSTSDDVQSALADDLDLIGAALSKYRHPSAVTHAFYRVSAVIRSDAPVSKL